MQGVMLQDAHGAALCWQQPCCSAPPVHGLLAAVRMCGIALPSAERLELNAAPGTATAAVGGSAVMLISA